MASGWRDGDVQKTATPERHSFEAIRASLRDDAATKSNRHLGGFGGGGGGGAVAPGGIENAPHAGMRLLTSSLWFQR
jgi:hypothetical protein